MTIDRKNAGSDLLTHIGAFERALSTKIAEARLKGRVFDDKARIRHHRTSGRGAAAIEIGFRAGHGMDHVLTTIITEDVIDTSERRDDLASNFVRHIEHAIRRAPKGAATRRAIARATESVFVEARAEGIDLELLHLEAAPIHVFGPPGAEDDRAQVFYAHIVMPHLQDGRLTRDSYTIDATGAEEFAGYLSSRTLPELRALIREHSATRSKV